MKPEMSMARSALLRLLEANEATAGMYVRVHGKNLVVGREETLGGEQRKSDRVRLTRLDRATFVLGVKRHTGRWERTPFIGTMAEMVDAIQGCMQHLVAPY